MEDSNRNLDAVHLIEEDEFLQSTLKVKERRLKEMF